MADSSRRTWRRSWLTAVALSVVAGAGTVLVGAAPAAAAAGDHRLTKTAYSSLIDDLDALLPNVSVANVADDGNRTGSRCYPTMTNLSIAFCWNDNDQNTSYWTPQGISTSGDATATGLYQDRTVILTSWYDSDGNSLNKGVRISFVNYANTSAPTYRHVLLVEPTGTADAPSFRPVTVHAGGIAWYGNYLYVADTSYGFRVFDMNHIWRVSTGNTEIIGRQSDGSYHAFDYKYVLPQAFRYTQSTVNGATPLRFSTVSVSRTAATHSLAIAEWGDNPDAAGKRLARFDLAGDGLLATDSDALVHADAVYTISQRDIQGTALINGRYYLSQDDGSSYRGNLGVYRPGGSVTWYNDHLPDGVVEAQSYWPGRDQLWSLTEVAGKRRVFASRFSAYDPSTATVNDFNSDGDADVIGRDAATKDLILRRGDGFGRFESGAYPTGVNAGDFDALFSPGDFTGDGRADVIGRHAVSQDLYLYRGDGAGGFPSGPEWIGNNWSAFDVLFSPGDFNGDGNTDVIGRHGTTKDLYLYPGNGAGGFGSSMVIGTNWGAFDLVFSPGDFSGDGDADVIARDATTKELYLYQGNGVDGFKASGVIGTNWGAFDLLFSPGDFTGDGNADVIGRNATTKDLYLYRGDGWGRFQSGAELVDTNWAGFDLIF